MATALQTRRKDYDDVVYTRIHNLPESSKDLLEINSLIRDRWEIVAKLGAGSHSEVYGAYDHELETDVAIKAGLSHKRPMSDEGKILSKLEESPYFCRNICYLVVDGTQLLVMDLKGPSLNQINNHYGPLSLSTVLGVAQQMLAAIRDLHNVGYIHGDIKPGNFVSGLPPDEMDKIYLIDFSLTKKYMSKEKRAHSAVHPVGFPGTMKYASPVLHQTRQLCRRDDLFSLIFTLLELRGPLPWATLPMATSILESKLTTTDELIKERLGGTMINFKHYINRLQSRDTPDYSRLEKYLDKTIEENNLDMTKDFEWVTNPYRLYRTTRLGDSRKLSIIDRTHRQSIGYDTRSHRSSLTPSTYATQRRRSSVVDDSRRKLIEQRRRSINSEAVKRRFSNASEKNGASKTRKSRDDLLESEEVELSKRLTVIDYMRESGTNILYVVDPIPSNKEPYSAAKKLSHDEYGHSSRSPFGKEKLTRNAPAKETGQTSKHPLANTHREKHHQDLTTNDQENRSKTSHVESKADKHNEKHDKNEHIEDSPLSKLSVISKQRRGKHKEKHVHHEPDNDSAQGREKHSKNEHTQDSNHRSKSSVISTERHTKPKEKKHVRHERDVESPQGSRLSIDTKEKYSKHKHKHGPKTDSNAKREHTQDRGKDNISADSERNGSIVEKIKNLMKSKETRKRRTDQKDGEPTDNSNEPSSRNRPNEAKINRSHKCSTEAIAYCTENESSVGEKSSNVVSGCVPQVDATGSQKQKYTEEPFIKSEHTWNSSLKGSLLQCIPQDDTKNKHSAMGVEDIPETGTASRSMKFLVDCRRENAQMKIQSRVIIVY